MNNSLLPAIFLCLLVGPATVSAAPLRDVPPGHWAAPAVRSVVQKKIMSLQPDGTFQGGKPVTRYELAVALDRFIRYIEAGRKPLHALSSPAAAIPPGADASVRDALIHLSTGGFLPAASPLFHGKGTEPVTARQLSDALAEVTIRQSDRSLPPEKG